MLFWTLIVYHALSTVIDCDIVTVWTQSKCLNLMKNYKHSDIFNADETGVFYKLLPSRTLQMKGESYHCGKKS